MSMDPHAVLLAQAFNADPAVRYLLPDPERRRRVMTHSFASYLRYGGRFGQVDLSPAGAAIWLPDDALPVTLFATPTEVTEVKNPSVLRRSSS